MSSTLLFVTQQVIGRWGGISSCSSNVMSRRCCLSTSARAKSFQRKAQELCGAPASIGCIPDGAQETTRRTTGDFRKRGEDNTPSVAGAVIRPVGGIRRVYLLKPYLTPSELEGLAYRIRVLSKNGSLNSVLIATSDEDDSVTDCLPASALELERLGEEEVDWGFDDAIPEGQTWHVAGGYDPLAVATSGMDKDAIDAMLESLKQLALATRGGDGEQEEWKEWKKPKPEIPVISIPHGMIEDGGFAFCLSNYVLATRQSCFRIVHPTRGLSLDPVGLSYVLPRLGREFHQVCAEYEPGMLLALTGWQADASDMVETGLATHAMNNFASTSTLAMLERTLADLRPWDQQQYVKKPRRYQGQPEFTIDHNKDFRNVAVAKTIHAFTSFRADGGDIWTTDPLEDGDAILEAYKDCHPVPWHEERESNLINYAYTFDEILKRPTLVEILEGFREIAHRSTNDPEEKEGIQLAADFVQRMEQRSPLALCVTHRLMKMGAQGTQTLHTCMEREKQVQARLFTMPDYQNWAQYAKKHESGKKMTPFTGWNHNSISDVTEDEVLEVIR